MSKDCDNCYWLEPRFEDNETQCENCAYGSAEGEDTTKWLHVNDEPAVVPPLRKIGSYHQPTTKKGAHMNINELTIGQAKEIASLVNGVRSNNQNSETLTGGMIGKKVIIRTYSAGVWFGTLSEKSGSEVILTEARRMWRWCASKGISLSACALYGVKHSESKIVEPVSQVWLEAIEIISCTDAAIQSIGEAPYVEAE